MITPFEAMQAALELAPTSPHPTNKIAASVFDIKNTPDFLVTRTNHWPQIIKDHFGMETKIGNSSGTIHAETACLTALGFNAAEGASICITDPFCPNCAKNIAEAGIKNIYIDEAGFEKDFFKRRSGHFDVMSMQVAARAGINVYALNNATQQQRVIYEAPKDYIPENDSPIEVIKINALSEPDFLTHIQNAEEKHKRRKFTLSFVKDSNGDAYCLIARAHAVIGYSLQKPDEALELMRPIGKYSFIQEPVNRMIMFIARKGYHLIDDYFYCSQVPTSREQVNLVGAGIWRISVGDYQKSRDSYGIKAMEVLKVAKIIDYS